MLVAQEIGHVISGYTGHVNLAVRYSQVPILQLRNNASYSDAVFDAIASAHTNEAPYNNIGARRATDRPQTEAQPGPQVGVQAQARRRQIFGQVRLSLR